MEGGGCQLPSVLRVPACPLMAMRKRSACREVARQVATSGSSRDLPAASWAQDESSVFHAFGPSVDRESGELPPTCRQTCVPKLCSDLGPASSPWSQRGAGTSVLLSCLPCSTGQPASWPQACGWWPKRQKTSMGWVFSLPAGVQVDGKVASLRWAGGQLVLLCLRQGCHGGQAVLLRAQLTITITCRHQTACGSPPLLQDEPLTDGRDKRPRVGAPTSTHGPQPHASLDFTGTGQPRVGTPGLHSPKAGTTVATPRNHRLQRGVSSMNGGFYSTNRKDSLTRPLEREPAETGICEKIWFFGQLKSNPSLSRAA